MTFRDTPWPDGTPCWVDLMVPDAAKAQAFYGELLGWEFADAGDADNPYLLATLDGRQVAGLGQNGTNPDLPPVWTSYIAVSDIDAVAGTIERAGGKVILPPMAIPPAGTMAVFADPTGAVFGCWQAGEHHGVEVANVPGAWTWGEVMTRDYDTAKAFYTEVFGYQLEDMSDHQVSYSTLAVNGEVVGGLGGLAPGMPAGVPSHWRVYFAVSDTDAALQRITELGGSVQGAPFDSPYGRLAPVTDDQGVPFLVISTSQQS
ncbi:MAG: VOC family protein [Haloechinothrix sp.]